jgi:hypothetical protein
MNRKTTTLKWSLAAAGRPIGFALADTLSLGQFAPTAFLGQASYISYFIAANG